MLSKFTHARQQMNHLIRSCHESQNGFRLAADRLGDLGAWVGMMKVSAQYKLFAEDLTSMMFYFGEKPSMLLNVSGYGMWTHFSTTLTASRQAILIECEKQVHYTVNLYAQSREVAIFLPVRRMIEEQASQVQAAIGRIQGWRNGFLSDAEQLKVTPG